MASCPVVLLLIVLAVRLAGRADAAPATDTAKIMYADQAQSNNNNIFSTDDFAAAANVSAPNRTNNISDYVRTMRNRHRENDQDERTKVNWMQALKENILRQTGRSNMTVAKADPKLTALNFSDIIPNFLNGTTFDDHITEKIRSFYPSCEIPYNTDQDVWKDDNFMNLFFNFDYTEINQNIATATLRLYRLPPTNATKSGPKIADCNNNNSTEEEKLLRVSVSWYTKPLKKRRVKRSLSDSKVISEHARWVELSVKPAAKAWARGRNLGLAVHVEDQEGGTLRADKFFKGSSCMVGTSTPKPIPTIIIDAAQQTNELDRIHSLLGGGAAAAASGALPMFPTLDVCTLEFPDNVTVPPDDDATDAALGTLRIDACNLRRQFDQRRTLVERERFERLAALPDVLVPSSRHIRHQRQHLASKAATDTIAFDPRSKIIGKRILLTNEEFQHFDINTTKIDR